MPGMYDVPSLGLNYRMAEIPAALGRRQLARLDEMLRRRAENFRALAEGLAGLPNLRMLDACRGDSQNSHYCLSVVLEGSAAARRDEIVRGLRDAGIGTSVYYPHPVPRLAYYRQKYGYDAAAFPRAAAISDASIALPVGPHITPADARQIAATLGQQLGETR
jgi:dTDP-4-amino-4,6-dideoxygalactose transaminase